MAVSTVEQKTILPEYQRDFLEKLLTDVRATATQPVEFPEIQIAERTPLQQQAVDRAKKGIGGFEELLQAGADSVKAGITALQPKGADRFQNKFLEDVLKQNLADITRQGDIARQQIGSRAVQQGAFG